MKDKLEKRCLKMKRVHVDWYDLLMCIRTPQECGYFFEIKYSRKHNISDNRLALATLRHFRGQKFIKWIQVQVAVLGFSRFMEDGSISYV